MSEIVENAENVVKEEQQDEKIEPETKPDLVPQLYAPHGGDPRELDMAFCVLLGRLPTDFLADTYEQFSDFIKNMLAGEHKLDPASIKQIIRIPKLETEAPNQSNALRVLLCFTEKTHKYRLMGRKKDMESDGLSVESLDELPAELLEISDEDAHELQNNDNDGNDKDEQDVTEEHEEEEEEEDDELAEQVDEDEEPESEKKEEEETKKEKAEKKSEVKEKKAAVPKKKVYADEDETAPFEMNWDGAPEFQWRLCDGPRDDKKLIIDNLLWADLNNVFIYRTIQKASNVDINFPMRFTIEGNKALHGKLTLIFPAFVPIMDEALKHLIYFRSGDGRRIKVFLPQTTASLKRKEEFEGKLGRLIKPTQRMMELVVKILPDAYTPSLDDACAWFPYQAVIGCELVHDEMGKPCAIVKFETAEEAVAAHAGKSFVVIQQTVKKTDDEGKETEETKKANCHVFLRGVEAHFGSLLTYFDQKKKQREMSIAGKKKAPVAVVKRPAGSTIRGPAQKRRAPSPPKRATYKDARGGAGAINRNVRGGGAVGNRRGGSPPPARGGRGGRHNVGLSRSAPRSTYRNDSSFSGRAPARADAFSGYGYAQFENRFQSNDNNRHNVDPFGRPMYGGSNSSAFGSSFHRDETPRSYSSSFQDRRRY